MKSCDGRGLSIRITGPAWGWLFSLLIFCACASVPAPAPPSMNGERTPLIDLALDALAMQPGDLSMRPDLSSNPFALPLFRRWMEAPLKAPREAQERARGLLRSTDEARAWYSALAEAAGVGPLSPIPLQGAPVLTFPKDLPHRLTEALDPVLKALIAAERRLAEVREKIAPEER
ncbi:MAG: hypothetical protein JW821_20790, partial [Deltaproteobacteria bacterium]|nr:hypothetical protein [Deltaproteobacteria bacterium]